jgi:hypothetical protein
MSRQLKTLLVVALEKISMDRNAIRLVRRYEAFLVYVREF